MSYILDSLKKSDQERKRGSVPGLLSDHGESGPDLRQPQRRRWPYLLAGGLLLNAIVLAVWLTPWRPAEIAATDPETAVVALDRKEIADGPGAVPVSSAGPLQEPAADQTAAPSVAAAAEVPRVPPVMADGGGPQVDTGWRRSADGEGKGNAEAIEPGDRFPEILKASMPDAGEEQAPTDLLDREEVAEPAVELSPGGEEGAALAVEAVPGPSVPAAITRLAVELPAAAAKPEAPPEIDSLPASVRNGLPEIKVSVHYFSKEPASRLVRVNGRILREGQEVNGLLVEEIMPGGIVFIHGGKKFYTDVR